MTGMPGVVLVDLFGVIARPQAPEAVHALTEIAQVAAPAFVDAYWKQRAPYDRGQVTAVEYWRRVAAELGTVFDDRRVAELVAADIAGWSEVDDEMVDLIGWMKAAGVRLALLSNIPEDLAAYYEREHHRWLRHFELVAFSCRLGVAKPDPEAFRWCCRELGVAVDDLLFIDDRHDNVQAAGRLGIRTHLFTNPAAAAGALGFVTRTG